MTTRREGRGSGPEASSDPERRAESLHASVVVIGEKGLVILGPSGAGKSTLAGRLIAEARARGAFARLVGDDRVRITAHGDRVVAHPHPAIRGRIEQRGLGILDVDWLDGAVIALAITLDPSPSRLPATDTATITLAGIQLPQITLCADRDLASRAHLVFGWLGV